MDRIRDEVIERSKHELMINPILGKIGFYEDFEPDSDSAEVYFKVLDIKTAQSINLFQSKREIPDKILIDVDEVLPKEPLDVPYYTKHLTAIKSDLMGRINRLDEAEKAVNGLFVESKSPSL